MCGRCTLQSRAEQIAKIFGIGGLWDRWDKQEGEPIESCTILTTDANEPMMAIHEHKRVRPVAWSASTSSRERPPRRSQRLFSRRERN